MPHFSYRAINRRQLHIFNATGKVIQLIMRKDTPAPPVYDPTVSGNLFTRLEDPPEDSNHYLYRYIKAKFEEVDALTPAEAGRQRTVKGIITVPLLFVSLLQAAEFVDPYLDGSRFVKTSAILDEGRIFATVQIQSQTLKNVANPVQ